MTQPITLRPLTPDDGLALDRLLLAAPDTGRIRLTPHYVVDPSEAVRVRFEDGFLGAVAETPGFDGLVGACMMRFGRAQIEGEVRPFAFTNNLIVHPNYRRQGIGATLMKWRVQTAHDRFGDDVVILSLIQQGNVGSVRMVTKFLSQILPDRVLTIPMPTRRKPPRFPAGWGVHEAEDENLPTIARSLNDFYQDYNFYEPLTAATLNRWLHVTVAGQRFRHLMLLRDKSGEMLAAAGVTEGYRLSELHIEKLPLSIRLASSLLHLLPAGGVSRGIGIEKVWHAPGRPDALRLLVDHIRWAWRDQVNMVSCSLDPQGPLRQIFPTRPWTPTHKASVVVDAPVTISPDRLVAA